VRFWFVFPDILQYTVIYFMIVLLEYGTIVQNCGNGNVIEDLYTSKMMGGKYILREV
jgi:hypothetical protein